MRKSLFLLGLAATALIMGSCTDDDVVSPDKVVKNPVQTGEEIAFGSSVSGNGSDETSARIGTRTVYGERTSTGIPVYWESGDQVAIYCLQSSQPANHLVNYSIEPQAEDPTHSASVTKVNSDAAGLQWGSEDEHRFYAFYPASAVKGTDEEDETGMITANIPVNQRPASWTEGELDGVKTYFGLPNMDYAYMYAHTKVNKSEMENGDPINLAFKNLVTVLDITVQGPEKGSSPITVSNINVEAVDGENVILTGDFTCNIREAGDNTDEVSAECTAAGDLNMVRNTVSIPCYDRDKNQFITLEAGEQLNVKAYIIPDDDESHTIKPRQLQITVSMINGAARRKVLQTAEVVPHKVNRVRLPHLISGGTNYWLSDLPENVYLTELSLPGSKMSMSTAANNANPVYQGTTIEQQLHDGVRAFILHTRRNSNGDLRIVENTNLSLTDGLKEIADFLNESENEGKREFAFVLVTYSPGTGSNADWFNSLQSIINKCANDPQYRIFNGTIAPNTTLGDVANRIIVKSNYNSNEFIASAGDAPMLNSLWAGAYVEGGVPMTWGNPNGTPTFTWLYQESTHITDPERNCNYGYTAEFSRDEKFNYISRIFEESVDAYRNNDSHSTWFMNDLGGNYAYCNKTTFHSSSHNVVNDAEGLARDVNEFAIQELQNRADNASLGLVYMNFADKQANSGVQYRSDWLIQTVIDNNFKFQLRTAPSTSSGTQSYDSGFTSGGNVWQ